MGKADAVIILARPASLADAAATALGNRIQTAKDISTAIEYAQTLPGISGVLLIKDDRIGMWGDLKIVPIGQ